jgi:23S rRNA (guanosine2251-2'-O)-methyltransferase
VIERIKADPRSIRKLYLQKRTDLSGVVKEAKKAGLAFESVDKAWFKRKCGEVHTQGVMAEVPEFEYALFPLLLTECLDNSTIPVFVDGVTDPQNLGSIIRNLACLGGFSLVLPEHGSAHVNETVLRVASGGENYIKIARVTNTSSAIKKAKEKGIWIAGAVIGGGGDISEADLTFPLAVVIGSEGKGVRPGLQKHLDAGLSLSMRGAQLSYNVSVAASIFCYEITRRRMEKRP